MTPSILPDADTCYRALSARDRRFDGVFYVGVTTTGIYCRPVCPARLPARSSCRFFPNPGAAEVEGFRPCLRCRPERAPGRAIVDASRRVAERAAVRIGAGALNQGSVEDLATELHVGPRQLRRALKREYGATPIQLAQTHRLLLAKRLLTETSLPAGRVAFAKGDSTEAAPSGLRTSAYEGDEVASGGESFGGAAGMPRSVRNRSRRSLRSSPSQTSAILPSRIKAVTGTTLPGRIRMIRPSGSARRGKRIASLSEYSATVAFRSPGAMPTTVAPAS